MPGAIAIAAIAAEILAIVALVLIVALVGPAEPEAAQAYAERLGYWVGPIGGFAACVLAGWWVARGLAAAHILNGFILGAAVAAIDGSILVASGAAFEPVFAISNIGRVIAGSIGGWLASRSET